MKKTNDFIDSINIFSGIITYNDFDIDETIPFEKQCYSYKEDILQISYGDRFLLDVGWYPEGDPSGHFLVRGIQDFDWLNPLEKIECTSHHELKQAIERIARMLAAKQKIKNLPFREIEYESFDE